MSNNADKKPQLTTVTICIHGGAAVTYSGKAGENAIEHLRKTILPDIDLGDPDCAILIEDKSPILSDDEPDREYHKVPHSSLGEQLRECRDDLIQTMNQIVGMPIIGERG